MLIDSTEWTVMRRMVRLRARRKERRKFRAGGGDGEVRRWVK